jgi:hypothetical protein
MRYKIIFTNVHTNIKTLIYNLLFILKTFVRERIRLYSSLCTIAVRSMDISTGNGSDFTHYSPKVSVSLTAHSVNWRVLEGHLRL